VDLTESPPMTPSKKSMVTQWEKEAMELKQQRNDEEMALALAHAEAQKVTLCDNLLTVRRHGPKTRHRHQAHGAKRKN
jgi:hypothetical protein